MSRIACGTELVTPLLMPAVTAWLSFTIASPNVKQNLDCMPWSLYQLI